MSELPAFIQGDIVRLKSGSPNMTVIIQKDNAVRCMYWHDNMHKTEICEIYRPLLESFTESCERQKDQAAQAEGGLLRLPPNATDENTLVLMFPNQEIKEQFMAEANGSSLGATTLFGSGGPSGMN